MYICSKYYYLLQLNVQKDLNFPKGQKKSNAEGGHILTTLLCRDLTQMWWETQDSKALTESLYA